MTVASLDSGNPISSVAILVKVGTRNETSENLGANHAIRMAVGLSTTKKSSFNFCMNIQQLGGKVDVATSREYTLYTSQAPRNSIGEGISLLNIQYYL